MDDWGWVAPVIAATAALAGVAIGKLWDHRSSHNRWLREQRLESYTKLIAVAHEIVRETVAIVRGPVEGREDRYEAAMRLRPDLTMSISAVELVGPQSLVPTMTDLLAAVMAFGDSVSTSAKLDELKPLAGQPNHWPEMQALGEALNAFVAEAREVVQSR